MELNSKQQKIYFEISEIISSNNGSSLNNKIFDYVNKFEYENQQLKGKIKSLENNCKQASDSCRQHRLASKNHIRRLKRREQQRDLYKSVIDEIYAHIEDKIRKSMLAEWGESTNRSDRLFTETIIELQLIEEILNKTNIKENDIDES